MDGSAGDLSAYAVDAKGLEVYELNLEKYKDRRDAVQKKTFTKWVNKHLAKADEEVADLFTDLQDGFALILLLEVLTGEQLHREKGLMRFHRIQNVQTCLAFLKELNVKLVNIRAEDIVDGSAKLTMGLIWTIILHFQVSEPWSTERGGTVMSARDGLLDWVQQVTRAYPQVNVKNFSTSWNDGLTFCAIMHHYRPNLINWREVLRRMTPLQRLETAFRLAESEFGVTRLLDPEDVDVDVPDEKSVITYVSSLYDALERAEPESYDQEFAQYCNQAQALRSWMTRCVQQFEERSWQSVDVRNLLADIERFRASDLLARSREKRQLEKLYARLEELFGDTAHMNQLEPSMQKLNQLWDQLIDAISVRETYLLHESTDAGAAGASAAIGGMMTDMDLDHEIGVLNDKLDAILRRIEDAEDRGRSLSSADLQLLLEGIMNDLNDLEAPVERLFKAVEVLVANGHPDGLKFRPLVYGLHQRRIAYLQRCNARYLMEPNVRSEYICRLEQERYLRTREEVFTSVKKAIEWVERHLVDLADMKFKESLPYLEELLENHKLDHREVMDFRHQVDQCIARQMEVGAEDTEDYCNHLSTLEKEYHQLRELSTGRMLDLDSLIAFVRSAQMELLWISEREEVEVARNWSDIEQLDLPMLQNYYKQLMHEIELREGQFNVVHDQGAALVNQRHPAVEVIEAYLNTMQSQWDWLLGLTQCLESHLHDAVNLREFLDDAAACERWMERQLQLIEAESSRGVLKPDEGDRLLDDLEEMREVMDRYHEILSSLAERSRTISPLWQRGEAVMSPIPINCLCNYIKKDAVIHKGDQCTLLDNSESLTTWSVRTEEGFTCDAPSVIYRIPPLDDRIAAYYQRLQSIYDRLRRSWLELYQSTRFALISKAMREVCSWDLKQFLSIEPENREAIIRAINDDVNKLLDDLEKNDPMVLQLRDELNATNEHFYKLLQQALREPDSDLGDSFEKKANQLIQSLEDAWRVLNQRVTNPIPKNGAQLDRVVDEHKSFEDSLQSHDTDVTTLQELFRQLRQPSPLHRSLLDQVLSRWEDLWELAKLYAERLKAMEMVLGSIVEATEICLAHERTLGSYEAMPADLERLRAVHAELLELQLLLQQQQPVFQDLASNVARMRQYVSRTRPSMAEHVDVDHAEEIVQQLTVRWENICKQVIDRLKSTELATPILLVCRGAYEDEISWLDRVEKTINNLRHADLLKPEEYQDQLDLLMAEYTNLNERTSAVERVNREGGRFIREAKLYDTTLTQYRDVLSETTPSLRFGPFSSPTGCQVVTRELEELNHRFSQLASVILERRNVIQVLMQNWRRQKEEEERRRRAMEEAARRAEEEARRRAEDEAERLRRLKEEEERRRRAAEDEAERLRRIREEEEARRQAEEARRKAEEEARHLAEEARRRAEEEARRRAAEEARRLAELEAARLRDEEEARRRAAEEARRRREEEEARRRAQEEADRLKALRDREDALRRAEEEARRRAEEEGKRRAGDEATRRRAEETKRRTEEEARRRAEEEARRRVAEDARRRAEEEARRRAEEEARRRAEEEARRRAEEEGRRRKPLDVKTGREWGEAMEWGEAGDLEETSDLAGVAKISEHEEDMIMYAEETEVRTKFFELEAVKHLQTGEILTFVEAARQGVLDLSSGEFFDVVSGSRISLEEAVRRGFVSQSLTDCLSTQYGIHHPETRQPLTLLEAIQCGLYDPEIRQLKNPTTGEMLSLFDASQMGIITMDNVHRLIKMGVLKLPPLSLQQAIEQAVIDLQTGTFIGRFSRETLPLTEALRNGYVSLSPQTMPMVGISLTDCIEQRFVHPSTGEFVDQRSGEKISMREALSKKAPLVNLDVREIVHTAERRRITVGEAVFRNVLNTRMSNFTDTQQRQAISLLDAYEQELIQKPLTLFDVCTKGLFDSSGRFVDGGTKRRMVLLEAIADGLIDPDVPHIMDLDEQEVISLATALERGIITPAGEYMMHAPMKAMSIQEAVTAGHIVLPVRYSLFDVKAVRDTKRKAIVSFNEAVDEGIVALDSRRFLDTASNQNYSLQQLQSTNLVEPVLLNVLTQMSGFKGPGGEHVTVFDAVALAMIDPKKRVLLNTRREHFTPREAYESGLISLRGAMFMSGLFDVHPSLVYLGHGPKPRRKRIERTKATTDGLRMTLGEALYQGLVDPKTRVVEGGRDMSLQEAVDTGFLDTSIEWIVPDKGNEFGPTIQESQSETVTETSQVLKPLITPDRHIEETTTTVKRQRITETTAVGGGPGSISTYRAIAARNGRLEVPVDGLHVYAAQRMGLFDLATGVLTVPDLQREFSFEEALELGIINGSSIKARDRRTSRFVGVSEAISAGILDSHGFYMDSLSNRRMSLQAAIDASMVVVDPEGEALATKKIIQFSAGPTLGSVVSFKPTGTSVREITETSLTFSGVTGEVLDTQTNERFSLDEALRREKISEDDFVITDALMERQLTFAEAEKWGVVDPNSKMYVNKRLNRICSLQEAARQGLVALTFGIAKPSSDALETHVHRQQKKVVATKESVLAGPAAFVDYSLQRVIELGWYDPKTGAFTHPDTKKHMSLKQAIIKGLFNPYESTVVDPASKEEMNLLDAIQSGVLDADKGRVCDISSGREYDLEEACRQGIISSGVVAQSLDALIASGRLDLNEGAVLLPDGRAPLLLHEAIAKRLVDTTSIQVMDPGSGEEMKYDQAVRKKVVDGVRGLVVNKNTGEAVSFIQAIRSGVIKPLSRPDTARYQMVSPPAPSSMRAAPIPPPKKKGDFAAKGREEMVDIGGKQVMVKVIRDEHGVEKGEYVDPETNMKFTVQLHGDPYTTRTQTSVKSTSQVQSVELSPFAELIGIDTVQDKRSGRIMTLAEAQRAGLASVDRKGKQLTKTYAIFRSDIVHALNHGIVDPTTGERLSLEDAIKSRIVDIDALVMWHPDTGERMDFAQAANLGLMDVTLAEVLPKGVCHPVNGERISIRRAIELKIVNPRTGVVCNPFSNEKLTWVSIVKPVYASLVMEGVYDPRKGYAVPVSRALNEGLIDVRKETYCNPITGEVLPLEEASQLGLVDESTYKVMIQKSIRDFQSGQMVNLLQAVDRGLVNTHERTVTVDKSVTVPISKAMEDGKFPKEMGRLLKRVDKLTFAEALGQGLIDVATNQFTDPDSGRKMTISAALERGYIDTGSVETLDGVDERNLSNVIHSEEFDENSGRIRDQKSGLYLTFKQAIERRIIDPDSLIYDVISGRAMTVNEALNRGRIDFNGKFVDPKTGTKINLKDAIRVGLIGTIASPMQAAQAAAEAIKRRETEGVRFSFERPVPQGPTASATLLEEIVTAKGQQPQKIICLQHEDDHQTVVEGPLVSSSVDLQTEFLTHLLKDCLDLDEPVMKNPATGQAVSVNQAVDQGLLDVASGEIVNPHSGEHFSITRAVQLHLVPPKIASSIMTALNKSMEEREPSSSRAPQHQVHTFTKEVYWHGKPSELRESGGDMSEYTTVSGIRSLRYDESL